MKQTKNNKPPENAGGGRTDQNVLGAVQYRLYTQPKTKAKYLMYVCPGCKNEHAIPVTGKGAWGYNNKLNCPTLTPSVKTTSVNMKPPEICHHFVRNGKIEFLSDCTHNLAGTTV